MSKEIINTDNAPAAVGAYSQAVKVDNTVYISGQIPFLPGTMTMIEGTVSDKVHQVFKNLQAVCIAGGGDLDKIVKLTIFLNDFKHFATINEVMAEYFQKPYPARSAIGVKQLPMDAFVEMEAIMVLDV